MVRPLKINMEKLFVLLHTKPPLEKFISESTTFSPEELIKAVTPHGENLLVIAAQHDLVEIASHLVKQGLYKNQPDFRGGTPLMRAALAKSTKCIDYLITQFVDPRAISSFSGKRAADMITYDPLTQYAAKFEALMKNPYFNYRYRVAEFYRTGLAILAHPNPGFYQGFPQHPLLAGVPQENWTSKINNLYALEEKYETFLTGPVKDDMKRLCLHCEQVTENQCSCKKVRVCAKCLSSGDKLMNMYRDLHINNCKRGQFNDYTI